MEHSRAPIEEDGHPGTCPFFELGSEALQKAFHISPLDVARGGLPDEGRQNPVVLSTHEIMLPEVASICKTEGLLS
jgi:hypothetical protein